MVSPKTALKPLVNVDLAMPTDRASLVIVGGGANCRVSMFRAMCRHFNSRSVYSSLGAPEDEPKLCTAQHSSSSASASVYTSASVPDNGLSINRVVTSNV